ncbi:MAG: pseudouridine-5'-phosphate glycosidase [Sediminimonas qiaohouensis]|uniref:Pseudouridine-5'-phosphate glycosidase n=1 Tax=Sediminimonas qiaohouensis TaxID=552061 RepID=A0A7C9HNV1_9RHOB|nr:pseudouridine-5'-phosphate glycosidase [Sediminimonas qiaohouensis]MTJ05223.1 pseudouridine-5'-phosphate glycosidase [Sediminimonas qiaohouensis]
MSVLSLSPEVARARAQGLPVVALESTIITHGMPWPQNLETARQVEADVREAGAVPATIAVLDGTLYAGLSEAQIDTLARARRVAKLSRADLAACMATGGTGSTTVAATMIAAATAGIATFATGGIGGVHMGGENSLDISADLYELSKTPVTVVCAGAKAILDLPRTLEVLETLGVPVIAYGQDTLPAFWSSSSEMNAPLRMDSAAQIAQAHLIRANLGLAGGQLVANPVPRADEIPQSEMRPVIAQAMMDADELGIAGKALTPFLLRRIHDLTGARALETNIALVRNNARLAAQIAAELSKAG